MSVEIALAQGYVATVDDEDVDLVELNWSIVRRRSQVHVCRPIKTSGRWTTEYLHRVVLARMCNRPLSSRELCDHLDGDGLNNRRGNLRAATYGQNARNRRARSDNTSGFKGAVWHRGAQKWMAQIGADGHSTYLGLYDTAEEAHAAYVAAALKFHGEFANDGQRPLRLADAPPALVQLPLFDMEIAS